MSKVSEDLDRTQFTELASQLSDNCLLIGVHPNLIFEKVINVDWIDKEVTALNEQFVSFN